RPARRFACPDGHRRLEVVRLVEHAEAHHPHLGAGRGTAEDWRAARGAMRAGQRVAAIGDIVMCRRWPLDTDVSGQENRIMCRPARCNLLAAPAPTLPNRQRLTDDADFDRSARAAAAITHRLSRPAAAP